MFDKAIEGVLQAFNALIPDKNTSTPQWLLRISTLFILFGSGFYLFLMSIKGTKLGDNLGFNRVVTTPELTHLELKEIQSDAYTAFLRAREDKPEIEAVLLISAYDNEGMLTYVKDSLILGVFVWYVPDKQYLSIQTLENIIWFNRSAVESTVVKNKQCVANEIKSQNIARYKQAMDNFRSNRFVLCPVIAASGEVDGEILVLWQGQENKPNLAAYSADVLETTKLIADQVANSSNSKVVVPENQK